MVDQDLGCVIHTVVVCCRVSITPNSSVRNFKLPNTQSAARQASLSLPGPEVIKLFMLNSAEHELYPAHKC